MSADEAGNWAVLDAERLERDVRDAMERHRAPGVAAAVVRGGGLVYAQGFGVTSAEEVGLPVTPRTLFRIASVTKALTATAIMRLVDAGALGLDVPVTEYLPWLQLSEPGAAARVTLRMLLSHTSGLSRGAVVFHGPRDPGGLADFVRHEVPRLPLVAPPGTVPHYSNAGASVAGCVAERVAGTPFAKLVRELVFEPLAMERATFDPLVALTYPLAHGHDLEGGVLRQRHRFIETTAFHPAGCAILTALDLATFSLLHLNGGRVGEKRLLSPESAAEMQRVQASFCTVPGAGYGLGLEMGRRGARRWVGHTGSAPGFAAHWWLLPEKRVGMVLLCNLEENQFLDVLCSKTLDLLLGPAPSTAYQPTPVEPDRAWWSHYTGTYAGPEGDVVSIGLVDGRLSLDWRGRRTVSAPLEALGGHRYFAAREDGGAAAYVGFVPDTAGRVEYALVNAGWCRRTHSD